MEKIKPSKAYYIKLGKGGKWEEECKRTGTLRVGWSGIPHELCVKRDWQAIKAMEIKEGWVKPGGAATRDVNELQWFYEADETVLWITFFDEKLWWCFSKSGVSQEPGGTKIRQVVGSWSSEDINGQPLYINKLSGKLTRTQAYRGTICSVIEFEYLVKRINAEIPEDVKDANEAKINLQEKLQGLIRLLTPYDFEILVELIFSRAGLQKITLTGKTQKFIDILYQSPITDEYYCVQVKSESGLKEFEEYAQNFENTGYDRFFFVVHTPKKDLEEYAEKMKSDKRRFILGVRGVSEMVIKYGLVDWIIEKTS